MIRYSVLIAQRNAGEAVAAQLARLAPVMDLLDLPYEMICIDDGSALPTTGALLGLLGKYPPLRLLRFDKPQGVSAALTAGIAAAEGDIVIAIAPGLQYNVEQVPHLIAGLSRGDLICGRRRRGKVFDAIARFLSLTRRLLLGREPRDPECQFWAARHEAIAGIELARGMYRYLPSLVARRGYRINEMAVDFCRRVSSPSDAWPNPCDLLCVWWLGRRSRMAIAQEITLEQPDGRPRIKLARIDGPELFHRRRAARPQAVARRT